MRYYFSYFLKKTICCEYSLEVPYFEKYLKLSIFGQVNLGQVDFNHLLAVNYGQVIEFDNSTTLNYVIYILFYCCASLLLNKWSH